MFPGRGSRLALSSPSSSVSALYGFLSSEVSTHRHHFAHSSFRASGSPESVLTAVHDSCPLYGRLVRLGPAAPGIVCSLRNESGLLYQ